MSKAKVKEGKFVLRLPSQYVDALDGLVRMGISKSRNDLIVTIVASFLRDLEAHAKLRSK